MISASRNKNNKKIERDRSQEIKIKIKKRLVQKNWKVKRNLFYHRFSVVCMFIHF